MLYANHSQCSQETVKGIIGDVKSISVTVTCGGLKDLALKVRLVEKRCLMGGQKLTSALIRAYPTRPGNRARLPAAVEQIRSFVNPTDVFFKGEACGVISFVGGNPLGPRRLN